MFESIFNALYETLVMVLLSGILSIFISLLLVTNLSYTNKKNKFGILFRKITSNTLQFISLTPFLLVMLIMAPVVKIFISLKIAVNTAVCLPLTVVGVAFFTQQLNKIFAAIPMEIKEMAYHMGATKFQLIFKFIIPESLPKIIYSISELMVKLTKFSTIAGVFGAGGLGYIAMQYGYYNFNLHYLIAIIVALLILIKLFQLTGFLLAQKAIKR